MRALLIISHGSRKAQSNSEVQKLADRIDSLLKDEFEIVSSAFLELAEPSVPKAIDLCIQEGADEILILPYFLAAGRHVAQDIPEIVKTSKNKHPSTSITIAPHIGISELMPEFLVKTTKRYISGENNRS